MIMLQFIREARQKMSDSLDVVVPPYCLVWTNGLSSHQFNCTGAKGLTWLLDTVYLPLSAVLPSLLD